MKKVWALLCFFFSQRSEGSASSSPYGLKLELPKLELPWGKNDDVHPSCDEGISDDELKQAYDELSGILDQETLLPAAMKVIAAGTLEGSSSSTWKVSFSSST